MIVDYLAEALREMRKRTFGDAINKHFRLGRDLNQRDTIAVKRTVSGLLKLLYPNEEYDKEAVRRCLEYALETRRRVKEQLKKTLSKKISRNRPKVLSGVAKSEREARLRLENHLKASHARVLKIEAELQSLKRAAKSKPEKVKDIRERVLDMIADYKERFK